LHAELARSDPVSAERIHPNDLRRIERALEVFLTTGERLSDLQRQWEEFAPGSGARRYESVLVGLRRDRADLHGRINRRVERMFGEGLLDEVRRLMEDPRGIGREASQAVGYKEVFPVIRGERRVAEAAEEVKRRTRLLAKHQRTWFRRFDDARWVDLDPDEEPERTAERAARMLGIGAGAATARGGGDASGS